MKVLEREKKIVNSLLGRGRKVLAPVESFCTKLGPCMKRGQRPGDDCKETACFYHKGVR